MDNAMTPIFKTWCSARNEGLGWLESYTIAKMFLSCKYEFPSWIL